MAKPGRDKIDDLRIGMKLPGIVTNVTNFGAFVDIGVHQDGLVHVSQLSDTFVSDPKTVVKVQQKVMVTVTEIDIQRKRIALTMKGNGAGASQSRSQNSGSSNSKPQNRPISQPVSTKEESYEDKLAQLKSMFGK